jgi:hypothetical protein
MMLTTSNSTETLIVGATAQDTLRHSDTFRDSPDWLGAQASLESHRFAMVDAGRQAPVPRPQPANRVLIIVARTRPAQYTYLRHAFEPDAIDVIIDRRVETRRQREEKTTGVEQRAGTGVAAISPTILSGLAGPS